MIDLSVHLITYNNEKHIEEALQTILKQKVDFTYEIVIGDDCSTDNTLNIINTYASKQPDIFKVVKNEKQLGILENFKATLDRCCGTYVFDIAGDDLLKSEDALQKMVTILQNDSSLGFVDSGFDELNESDNTIISFKNINVINAEKENYKNEVILGRVSPTGHCYNKAFLYKYVDFDVYLKMKLTIEDYPILVDMVMHTNFAIVKESLHIYRVHDDSHSHQRNFENHLFHKNQMNTLFDYFSNKYNFSKQINDLYTQNLNKELLFLAGYFEKKILGKEIFKKISSKTFSDYVHYYASQYYLIRKLISLRKKLLTFK
jgi:glycosyltransferase involved in cell wall biosynthesis